jgi:hypothetical protein
LEVIHDPDNHCVHRALGVRRHCRPKAADSGRFFYATVNLIFERNRSDASDNFLLEIYYNALQQFGLRIVFFRQAVRHLW